MAAGVMATTAPWASTSVLGADDCDAAAAVVPALHVAPGQRRRLGTPQSGVGQHDNQGQVEPAPFLSLLGRFEAATALAGLAVVRAAAWRWGFERRRPHPFKAARTPWSRHGDSSLAHLCALVMAAVVMGGSPAAGFRWRFRRVKDAR